jgi:hypothetical protein
MTTWGFNVAGVAGGESTISDMIIRVNNYDECV